MKPIVALIYDFDRTLATEDMQNFGFIPSLQMTPEDFWSATQKFCDINNMDKILGYLYVMIKLSKEKNVKMTRDFLNQQGKSIKFYEGVLTWFKRINEYGKEKGLKVEHYLITSGNKEIIDGTSIAKEFKKIFACEFLYDKDTKVAYRPKTMVNYTQKTQYIFRISKGAINSNDDIEINEKTKKRRIRHENMIYIGDGLTDVPAMVIVKQDNGHAIAVYPKGQRERVSKLFDDGRVNYICKADYSINGELEKVVKLIIDSIAIEETLYYKAKKTEKII
jgi:phosphoserine phosphatase